ncbi:MULTISPECIES: hypothetical protein [Sphingomonadales]|jgi:hypothetical protein|uniref:Uncharacterized protein n=5 Tax=Sphingomonadaceae TaxID=41297 RepID=A0A1E1F8F0_9SPHN|nr:MULTISPECIES: hypothetical protein [Sphingomonadaceae]EPR17157.1 hypothetical protein M527_17565 [Sphingobium indicum IP26]EZP70277.1 hypothetical protein BV96_03520 [Sphingomonas paucimobilis]BAV66767.1 hypothetical protein SCLO_3001000 [Sphingobium cloacae]AMK20558.1 hypothetical protein K663_21008 [Sphingobium sp. MI1205]AMK21336.1 hypothetical protein K426_01875 [Sphingobium sp. TKS]
MDAAAHRRNGADIAVGRQPALRSLLHFYLHLIGFTASTLLLTWGLFALFFVALGGFSLDGLMHQLNNLTARYVAASPDRIASFKNIFIAAHLLIAAGLIVLRREKIVPAALPEGKADHG